MHQIYDFFCDDAIYYMVCNKKVNFAENLAEIEEKLKNIYPLDNEIDKLIYTNGYKLSPGTILNDELEVVAKPQCFQVNEDILENVDTEKIFYKYIDGTTLTVNKLGSKVLLTSANSWDISRISDISVTYRMLLDEALQENDIDIEDLVGKTILFTNESVHLMSNGKCISSLVDGTGYEELPVAYMDDNYIIYYPEYNVFYVQLNEDTKKCIQLIYADRAKRFRQRTDTSSKYAIVRTLVTLEYSMPGTINNVKLNDNCIKTQQSIRDWLKNIQKYPSTAKLLYNKKNIMDVKNMYPVTRLCVEHCE